MQATTNRFFSLGSRPVIRWVKGNGKDDPVTRSAIAQATRLFGDRVDYCLCVNGISMSRAREILAWATQPVELWVQDPADNPELAGLLARANCPPERFGYWWKWFPERVRPGAPEWVLDGDMVVVRQPGWFDAWAGGTDPARLAQDPTPPRAEMYGAYKDLPDERKLYSGLISLPPAYRYMHRMLDVLRQQPLASHHDGRVGMEEQGCLAAAFAHVPLEPIPLHEFPFAEAYKTELRFGESGRQGQPWGYHFSYAFRQENSHFSELVKTGEVYWQDQEPKVMERFVWLRNFGQWGWEGWSMQPAFVIKTDEVARAFAGKRVLDSGTSRGQLAAILATHGCRVTTVDAMDRGARQNLEGLDVQIVISDLAAYLRTCRGHFDLIVIDLHGNGRRTWKELWPLLPRHLAVSGRLLLYNSHLWKQPEAVTERGLKWVMRKRLRAWNTEVLENPPPGMVICDRGPWNRFFSRLMRGVIRAALPGKSADSKNTAA